MGNELQVMRLNIAICDDEKAGAEPEATSTQVQSRWNSTLGQKSIIVPPELEEKMKNDPELAKRVMANVENFITTYTATSVRPGRVCSWLISLDENGEIAHSCVTSESISVSSSEFAEANKKRRERQYQFYTEQNKRAESMRILEESALKRRQLTKAINNKNTAKGIILGAYKSNFFYE